MAIDRAKLRLTLRQPIFAQAALDPSSLPSSATNIAWENQKFQAPTDHVSPWLQELMWIASEKKVASRTVEMTGLYQIGVLSAQGQGTETGDAIATVLKSIYPAGLDLRYSAAPNLVQISIVETVDIGGRNFDDFWYIVAVRMKFRTFAVNPN